MKQEDVRRIWEWCGFKQVNLPYYTQERRSDGESHWLEEIRYCPSWNNGKHAHPKLPELTLDNLFKYAVPKLNELGYDLHLNQTGTELFWLFRADRIDSFYASFPEKSPAEAVAQAILKLIEAK